MIVITFHTTADAFGFEKACKTEGIEGGLTTVPRSISAGCGYCWEAPDSAEEQLAWLLKKAEHQGIYRR